MEYTGTHYTVNYEIPGSTTETTSKIQIPQLIF